VKVLYDLRFEFCPEGFLIRPTVPHVRFEGLREKTWPITVWTRTPYQPSAESSSTIFPSTTLRLSCHRTAAAPNAILTWRTSHVLQAWLAALDLRWDLHFHTAFLTRCCGTWLSDEGARKESRSWYTFQSSCILSLWVAAWSPLLMCRNKADPVNAFLFYLLFDVSLLESLFIHLCTMSDRAATILGS